MKKILAVILLLAFSAACFAQEPVPVQTQTKEDLLRKSKNQKTTGFIMLGAGAAAIAGGVILMAENAVVWSDDAASSSRFDAGAVLAVAGGLAMGGGVTFLIVSGNNKQKANALTASFKMEKGVPPILRDMGPTYYPALSLKLNIR